MSQTIRLADGKYEFDLDDLGLVVAARRHGVDWPAGYELRFTNAFVSALCRIRDLEASPSLPSGALSASDLVAACKNIGFDLTCGSCASQFYTGSSLYPHDAGCSTQRRETPR